MEKYRRSKGIKPNVKIAEGIKNKNHPVPRCIYCNSILNSKHTCNEYEQIMVIHELKREGYNSLEISRILHVKLREINEKWTILL
jgi:hypothetical protein